MSDTMTFKDFQKLAEKLSDYPGKGFSFLYPAFCLAGEVGQIVFLLASRWERENDIGCDDIDDAFRDRIANGIARTLCYLAALCCELGIDLNTVFDGRGERR